MQDQCNWDRIWTKLSQDCIDYYLDLGFAESVKRGWDFGSETEGQRKWLGGGEREVVVVVVVVVVGGLRLS